MTAAASWQSVGDVVVKNKDAGVLGYVAEDGGDG